MRVLFAGSPGAGHLMPLLPLATAFSLAGHDITFAGMDGAEAVTRAGMPFEPVARGLIWSREIRRLGAEVHPELLARTVETNSADRAAFVPLAAQVNLAALDSMREVLRSWRPDLVVYEYLFPAALVAAAELGIPAVQHELGFTRTAPLRALMLAELGAHAEPARVLEIAPPSMVTDPAGPPLRPVPFDGPGDLPPTSGRPRVAVTLGTVPPKVDGLTRLDRVVAAAAEVDAEFVLVMGRLDISELGPLPPNVIPRGWVPWHRLLTTCVAAVHHGGSGTALAALAAGVPQLLLPDGSDRFLTADAVHGRGAGVRAATGEISADLLRHVAHDAGLRAVAKEVRAEIESMPAPEAVVPALAGLAA
ncbi:UDP:flavonoid glycosyltransferase YjiC (YdhE family) [Crossiella equi]|uniref:UDP:flavonoid glycosyltransferase YjiC (YdhE family) n=1 Tax=Crossiella equi TaxID=130796 RepID=A0ABS5ARX8_9PSEU|nr:nucleotide disphospho-sugar-binding domain-containing protein [Crossiella equi]MBP2479313.1 UDP:flavonoid glycosyltransferase YjiC (YdhE family) [Crossiella equi]